MSPAGYSGTPLVKKLGLKPGGRGVVLNAPPSFTADLGPLPEPFALAHTLSRAKDLDYVHIFSDRAAEMQRHTLRAKACIKPEGMIWVSWPKKASKVPTDITEDTIRGFALASGLVDVKVCAIDDIWSGLKLVIPVKDRAASAAGPALGPKRTTRTAAKPSSAGTARAVKRAAPALQSKGSRRPRGTP